MADREHMHRDLWVGLAVALFIGGPGLSIALLSLENGHSHVGFWPHAGEVAGVALMMVGVLLGVAVVRGWWLPGGFKAKLNAPVPQPSILSALRDLRTEGLSLQARLADHRSIMLPPGLPAHIGRWEKDVSAALESRPALREQFEAPVPQPLLDIYPHDDLRRRLDTRMRVLEAIIRGLVEAPGHDG